jgi:hypothetical protein
MSEEPMRLIFFLFFLFAALNAEIIQIQKIEDSLKYLQDDTTIIFDLDNTIMEPVQTLGSDQWFSYRMNEYRKQGYSDQEALQKTMAEYVAIQNITRMKLVEPVSFQLIAELQKRGIPIIGLTTRSLILAPVTIRQLNSIGVDLSKTAPSQGEMLFEKESNIQFQQGILFTSGTDKGSAFLRMLEKSGYQPKKILFVDDKMSYLQQVEKVCLDRCILFTGLRYGYLDEKVKNMRPEIVSIQLEHLGLLLSDEEAELLF